MNNQGSLFILALAGLAATGCNSPNQESSPKPNSQQPNIVIILTDDLGYGDIGCFGAEDIKTPYIDGIAKQGMKFTEFYSASPVSSPSRAGLLTGRRPQRMGINGVFFPESFTGMAPSEITIAEMLKDKGYSTGLVGKWHLGHREKYLPLQQGFDSYFGIPYSNDMESIVYMEGNEVVSFDVDQRQMTKKYTEKAVEFIKTNKEKPFFLFLSHGMPHVPIYASDDFLGTSDRGLYGDVIQEIDWSVGQVLKTLKDQNILENTLVIFTSDNGPWLVMEERGGSNGILREGKQYTFEGGVRVPTVAMWPDVIPAGIKCQEMIQMFDLFPTIAKITGSPLPDDREYDGTNILPVLQNKQKRPKTEKLYFYLDDARAYRYKQWKYKEPFDGEKGSWWKKAVPAHGELLFNLKNDPGENNNLADSLPDILSMMKEKYDSALNALGELHPSLSVRESADLKHIDFLREHYPEKVK